tara:strand:+ start:654 stop:1049 length:396 start_codon:yes stop_codon:yes gene_type:complete
MTIENRNETTPAPASARPRASESLSLSPSGEKVLSFSDGLNPEGELSKDIADFWGVEDSSLVILEYGKSAVAKIHRRMLSMSRKQKLSHVDNLGGYFMSCLLPRRNRAGVDTERSDKFYEDYLKRQQERGL